MGNATNKEIKNELIYQKLNLFISINFYFFSIFLFSKIVLTIFFISFILISFNDLLLIFFLILATSFKHGVQPVEDLFKSIKGLFKFNFLTGAHLLYYGVFLFPTCFCHYFQCSSLVFSIF